MQRFILLSGLLVLITYSVVAGKYTHLTIKSNNGTSLDILVKDVTVLSEIFEQLTYEFKFKRHDKDKWSKINIDSIQEIRLNKERYILIEYKDRSTDSKVVEKVTYYRFAMLINDGIVQHLQAFERMDIDNQGSSVGLGLGGVSYSPGANQASQFTITYDFIHVQGITVKIYGRHVDEDHANYFDFCPDIQKRLLSKYYNKRSLQEFVNDCNTTCKDE